MKEIKTGISVGHLSLVEIFCRANELDVKFSTYSAGICPQILITYEEDSDTGIKITYMCYVHLGIINMLFDYLIRCGIMPSLISIGTTGRIGPAPSEEDFQEHLRKIGFKKDKNEYIDK